MEDINAAMEWVVKNTDKYYIDLNNIFIIGDSAGAQMALQYSTMISNPQYAAMFDFKIPQGIYLRAVALNCGIYNLLNSKNVMFRVLKQNYIGRGIRKYAKQLDVISNITAAFPPTYVMSAHNDYMLKNTEPFVKVLDNLGIHHEFKIYGTKEDKAIGHVFHVNIRLEEAAKCNNDEITFFREFICN